MNASTILLLTENEERRRQWAEALAEDAARVYLARSEVPAEATVDILITDQSRPTDAADRGELRTRGDAGVIAVGSVNPADVTLAEDFTPRELQLACRLLAEIVRLRREHHEGVRVRNVLTQLALSDPLTGLANRRSWEDELAARWQTAQTSHRTLCLALFDVDLFKRVNDEYGHAAGDRVLISVAKGLTTGVRPGDHVARLGGDEFGLLVFDLTLEDAQTVVERVRRHLVQPASEEVPLEVTASSGFAIFDEHRPPDTTPDAEALVRAADDALRHAKSQGRNQTVGGLLGSSQSPT